MILTISLQLSHSLYLSQIVGFKGNLLASNCLRKVFDSTFRPSGNRTTQRDFQRFFIARYRKRRLPYGLQVFEDSNGFWTGYSIFHEFVMDLTSSKYVALARTSSFLSVPILCFLSFIQIRLAFTPLLLAICKFVSGEVRDPFNCLS